MPQQSVSIVGLERNPRTSPEGVTIFLVAQPADREGTCPAPVDSSQTIYVVYVKNTIRMGPNQWWGERREGGREGDDGEVMDVCRRGGGVSIRIEEKRGVAEKEQEEERRRRGRRKEESRRSGRRRRQLQHKPRGVHPHHRILCRVQSEVMSQSSVNLKRCQLKRSAGDKSFGLLLTKSQYDIMTRIEAIKPDSPASFADLRIGDCIDSINCMSMRGKSLKEVESFVAGSTYMDVLIHRIDAAGYDSFDEALSDDEWAAALDHLAADPSPPPGSERNLPIRNLATAVSCSAGAVIDLLSDDDNDIASITTRPTLPARNYMVPSTDSYRQRPTVISLLSDDDDDDVSPAPAQFVGVVRSNSTSSKRPASATVTTPRSMKRPRPSPQSATTTASQLLPAKKEPVGFGCADVDDEVVEVVNPKLAALEAVQQATVEHGEDIVEFIGGNMMVASDMPHPREACTKVPFHRPSTMTPSFFTASNRQYCDQCYCFVCEVKAKDCPSWAHHCDAWHKDGQWKSLRNTLRSPLLSLLPPVQRMSMVAAVQKISTLSSDTLNQYLDKVREALCLPPLTQSTDSMVGSPKDIRQALHVREIASPCSFMRSVIEVVHMLKKTNGMSTSRQVLRTLLSAMLLTDCFTSSFSPVAMRSAIVEELCPRGPYLQPAYPEVLKIALLLSTACGASKADWVRSARISHPHDVPVSVGPMVQDVADMVYMCLEEVGCCSAALFEFASRQGGALTQKAFLRVVEAMDLDTALEAVCRMDLSKSESVSMLVDRIRRSAGEWGFPHCTAEIGMLRLCFLEIIFLENASKLMSTVDAGKVLLCIASLQMVKINKALSDGVKSGYLAAHGCAFPPSSSDNSAATGVDVEATISVLRNIGEDMSQMNPRDWATVFDPRNSNDEQKRRILDMTFALLLRFPAFTEKTILGVAQSVDVESARQRLSQMKKCVDSIFCSCECVGIRHISFAHQVFAQFLMARGKLMLRKSPVDSICEKAIVSMLSCLVAHVAGHFLGIAGEDEEEGALNFVRSLPADTFAVLTRPLPLATASVFSPISAGETEFQSQLTLWMSELESTHIEACLDDCTDNLRIARVLAKVTDNDRWQSTPRPNSGCTSRPPCKLLYRLSCNILYARLSRVSVAFLRLFQDVQQLQKSRLGKSTRKGERTCFDIWQDLLKTLAVIKTCVKYDSVDVSDVEHIGELVLAAKMSSRLNIPSSVEAVEQDPQAFGGQLSHTTVRQLKLEVVRDGGAMWGYWQRLFCSLAAGGDLLTMIIWENWTRLTIGGSVPHASMTALATDFDSRTDIDSSSCEKCTRLWKMIITYHEKAPNSSLAFLELCCARRSLLDAIMPYCPAAFVQVLTDTQSPSLFRYVRMQVESHPPAGPAADGLAQIWKQATEKVVLEVSAQLQAFATSSEQSAARWKERNMDRALLLATTLRNNFLVMRILSAGMPPVSAPSLSADEKTHAAAVIVSMFRMVETAEDLTFVLVHVMSWLRRVVIEVRDGLTSKMTRVTPSDESLRELVVRLTNMLQDVDKTLPHARVLSEALALFNPSMETVALFFKLSDPAQHGEEIGALVSAIQDLHMAGKVTNICYMELCYEFFGMEALQEFLVRQFVNKMDLQAPGLFFLNISDLILASAKYSSSEPSPLSTPPGSCGKGAKLNMSRFVLRWLAAVLLNQNVEVVSSEPSELRPLLQSLVSRVDKQSSPFAETPTSNSVITVSGKGVQELMPWFLSPSVAFNVISFFASPSLEAYANLPFTLSAAVKERLLSSTVDVANLSLFITLCMRERMYAKLFAVLLRFTSEVPISAVADWVDVLHRTFSKDHSLPCANTTIQVGRLLHSELASLAMCLRGGYLSSATAWLVLVSALSSGEVGVDGSLQQKLEALLRLIHENDIGEASQALCTCAAAFRANNMASLVEAIHRTVDTTLPKLSLEERSQLTSSPDWAPFGVVGTILTSVASAPWSDKDKVIKFVELYLLVVRAPQCICGKMVCGCHAVLESLTLVKRADDILRAYFLTMLSTRRRLEEADASALLACMRPLLTYVALHPSWAAQSLISNTMACLYQPGYINMVRMYDDRGPGRYFESNCWAMLMKLLVGKNIGQLTHLLYTCELTSWSQTAGLPDGAALFSKVDFIEAVICAYNLGDLVPWTAAVCELLPLSTAVGVSRVLEFLFSFTADDMGRSDHDNAVSVTWNSILSKTSLVSSFTLNLIAEVVRPMSSDAAVALLTTHPVLTDMLSQRFNGERLLFDHERLLPLWIMLVKASPKQATDMVTTVGKYMVTNRVTVTLRTAFENFIGTLKQLYKTEGIADRWAVVAGMLIQAVSKKKKLQQIVQNARY